MFFDLDAFGTLAGNQDPFGRHAYDYLPSREPLVTVGPVADDPAVVVSKQHHATDTIDEAAQNLGSAA
jgi:hypothetical protein